MKKNLLSMALLSMVMVGAMSSCEKEDDGTGYESEKNELMTSSIESYVDDVVISTYSSLATGAMSLYDACYTLDSALTDANISAAAAAWVSARKYWENSEAFLFGPAGDYAIDPRIDSWPLDQTALDNLLSNSTMMEGFYDEDGNPGGDDAVAYAGEVLGNTLLGFHAVEYMLFENGAARTAASFEAVNATAGVELAYLLCIVGDLRNQCILLECSWAGIDEISSAKAEIMEETELARALVYGEVMKSAGETGNSLYKSQKSAMSEILNGIITIVDEVGNTKIQDPIDSGNPFDVESWFSYNSITDFTDNIKGCQMAYAEISDYVKSLDADVDADVQAKFTTAILEIGGATGDGDGEGMAAPFRDNVGSGTATTDQQEAIDACNALMAAVEAADEVVNAQ
ncbi:MAG: imelysin family protein [Rikenellaceae bacterium]